MPTQLALSTAALLTVGQGAAGANAVHVDSARFAGAWDAAATGAPPLRLAGAGLLRWGWFVKVLAAAHYVDARAPTADPAADVTRRLELVYFVAVAASDLADAAEALLAADTARPSCGCSGFGSTGCAPSSGASVQATGTRSPTCPAAAPPSA
jgi:hypothetical protein